ncbi:hypothetical protein GCM10017667_00640 [Streptomyces filamentosus]|uniref:Uncharacterized protein n=1 Tax=Streptomyces filamentosus TaxID=67294 RepID=A0A919BA93_STRFL|nr:hypothetical protein GCM10017667_00640 [Streptomyces filamentosus]
MHACLLLQLDHQERRLVVQTGSGNQEEARRAGSVLAVTKRMGELTRDLNQILLAGQKRPDSIGQAGFELGILNDLTAQTPEDITELPLQGRASPVIEPAGRLAQYEWRRVFSSGALRHHMHDGPFYDKVTEVGPHIPPHVSPPVPRGSGASYLQTHSGRLGDLPDAPLCGSASVISHTS